MNQTKTIETLRETLSKALEIAEQSPELNMANYDEDQVATLNADMIALTLFLQDASNLPIPQPDEQRVRAALEAAREHVLAGYGIVENLATSTTGEACIELIDAALAQADTGAEKLSQVVTWIPVGERLPEPADGKFVLVAGVLPDGVKYVRECSSQYMYSSAVAWRKMPSYPEPLKSAAQLSPKQEGGE